MGAVEREFMPKKSCKLNLLGFNQKHQVDVEFWEIQTGIACTDAKITFVSTVVQ